ncbi:hypothetical protein [Nonomuraea diastatica]|nr:hypothetical protein [Nonomuraea diastatica]
MAEDGDMVRVLPSRAWPRTLSAPSSRAVRTLICVLPDAAGAR